MLGTHNIPVLKLLSVQKKRKADFLRNARNTRYPCSEAFISLGSDLIDKNF
jgi:hypothetical protein